MILGFNADEVFRVAIEIENNGILFYQKAYEFLQDENLKQVFLELKDKEEKHRTAFQDMRARLPESARRITD